MTYSTEEEYYYREEIEVVAPSSIGIAKLSPPQGPLKIHSNINSKRKTMDEPQTPVEVDLSAIRGIKPPKASPSKQKQDDGDVIDLSSPAAAKQSKAVKAGADTNHEDLEGLAELVPGLKSGKVGAAAVSNPGSTNLEAEMAVLMVGHGGANSISLGQGAMGDNTHSPELKKLPHLDSMVVNQGIEDDYEQDKEAARLLHLDKIGERNEDFVSADDESSSSEDSDEKTTSDLIKSYERQDIGKEDDGSSSDSSAGKTHASDNPDSKDILLRSYNNSGSVHAGNGSKRGKNDAAPSSNPNPYHSADGISRIPNTPPRVSNPNDDSYYNSPSPNAQTSGAMEGDFHPQSSNASFSTATQTQSNDVRMPMYLPNFRPATGCTNASDFIVRCFVARLRAGITVVKHGRSRWCKSRLRVLHVHSDGRSLSWRPAQGEPTSNKRPPKLDLSTCLEVRHAWSPDPLNPMFTGTPILRLKCEASNAFKSFALIFPRRTVDITAVTADQCKVLMEGFSALCFRLQVASMAGRGMGAAAGAAGTGMVGPKGDGEDGP